MSSKFFMLPGLILFIFGLLLRLPTFGSPILDFDESWYLYVGEQFLNGYWPYTDIWDRKPFGLFLLYAVFAAFESYRFLAYQMAALLFAWGTACLIYKLSRKFLPLFASCLAGMLYLALLMPLSGFGGQSPIFYNFFVALAFYLILSHCEVLENSPRQLSVTGLKAMLLIGIAIQIKPTVIWEGIFLGCLLLTLSWHSQQKPKTLCLNGVLWIAAALLPTFAIISLYWSLGHFQDWYFANILSIFMRKTLIWSDRTYLVLGFFVGFLLALSVILLSGLKEFSPQKRRYFDLILLWTIIAFISICLTPPYFSHYLLPFAVPFSLFSAFALEKIYGKLLFGLALIGISITGEMVFFHLQSKHPQTEYYHLKKILSAQPDTCLFEYGAAVTLLDLTPFMRKSCHLTKYSFPSHLGCEDETGALGIDELKELNTILAEKPGFILVGEKYLHADYHPPDSEQKLALFSAKNQRLSEVLQQDYHLIDTHNTSEKLELYERNDLLPKK